MLGGLHFPPWLGNSRFAGNEPNVSCYSGGPPGNRGVCVSVFHSLFPPLPSLHRVLGCLISCWRFGARVLRAFSGQEQKPDLQRQVWELSLEVCSWSLYDLEARCFFVGPQN